MIEKFLTLHYMLHISSSIKTSGNLPHPSKLKDLLDQKRLILIAQTIYDTNPNLVAQVETDTGFVVIKLFGWRHPIHRILSPAFPSRAQTSWDIAHALIKAGTLTPKPIYVYTKRKRGIILENFYITSAIHPHKTFRTLLKTDVEFSLLQTIITSLATSIARMHNAGIFHRDLTTGNFLVNNAGDAFIVDLNRAKIFEKLSPHHRLTDLAKINLRTKTDSTQTVLEELFFNAYKYETGIEFDWSSGYQDYRKILLARRRQKNRLRSFFS